MLRASHHMNPETQFLIGLMELQYGQKVQSKLRQLSPQVPWARGWPEDKQAFWNAEAFMWSRKIEQGTRAVIERELKSLATGKNLDLGCGAYSYIPSVGLDLSSQMLHLNARCYEKVRGDLEEKLPFEDKEFDSVTAVFVLNYVQNYAQLLQEIHRVLKPAGKFLVVGAASINQWQRQKQVHSFNAGEWRRKLEKEEFRVTSSRKIGWWFLKGAKKR